MLDDQTKKFSPAERQADAAFSGYTRRKFLHCAAVSAALTGLSSARLAQTQQAAGPARVIRHQPAGVDARLGVDLKKLDELAQLFGALLAEGLHPGAQLAVYRQGELVIELAGGKDGPPGNPVTTETLFQIRSTTKALATIAMLTLYERGRFSFNDLVAKHWPKFAQNGKEAITIAHVMGHRAGIPDGPPIPPDKMGDRAAVAAAVEAMKPVWPPGSANGYHAATLGWVCDELVYRWEKRSIAQFLQDELFQPFKIQDVHIGLSKANYPRMAQMVVDDYVREHQAQRARFSDFVNTYEGARLPLAWVMGMATARDLGRVMNLIAFEGKLGQRQFFSKETLKLASTPTNPPGEMDLRLQWPVRWGLGFILGDTPDIYGTPPHARAVGHAGGSAGVAWADPNRRLSVAFLCNSMLRSKPSWERYRRIGEAVYAALKK